MLQLKSTGLAVCILALVCVTHGADKYTDGNRPYEFGFTIDGEQHRHEKKDENGIVMGEFGFITADGVYHVTVYATDEQGRFKILSMKNIRVKPYPTAGVKKGHSIPFPPSENPPLVQGPVAPSVPQHESKPEPDTNKQIASPTKSCSHCSLPTTTTIAPKLTDIAVVAQDRGTLSNQGTIRSHPSLSAQHNQFYQQNNPALSNPNAQNNYKPQEANVNKYPETVEDTHYNYPQQENSINPFNSQQRNEVNQYSPNVNNENQYYSHPESNVNPSYPQIESDRHNEQPGQFGDIHKKYGQEPSINQPQPGQNAVDNNVRANLPNPPNSSRNPKQYSAISSQIGTGQHQGFKDILLSQEHQPISNKPTLIAAQMQIVPKNTDIHYKRPGEQDGLPKGLSKDDMTQLLYTFNYTVGFHGHHEKGYSNGAKQGYYYVTGRNGVRTRVDYVADEKGFRPRISQEVFDLLSDDVPKPETEKDQKFGLRGYEFKWLYYPADESKKH